MSPRFNQPVFVKIINRLLLLTLLTGFGTTAQALTFGAVKDADIHNFTRNPGVFAEQLGPTFNNDYKIFSYIGFDIDDFKSNGVNALNVSLELFTRTSSPGNGLPLNIYGLNEVNSLDPDWTERGITFSNAPGLSGNSINTAVTELLFDSSSLTYNNRPPNQKITFDTSAMTDFINMDTDGMISFILAVPTLSNTNHAFSSRESSGNPASGAAGNFAPRLNITAVPLPAALWLMIAALTALFSLRRQKQAS